MVTSGKNRQPRLPSSNDGPGTALVLLMGTEESFGRTWQPWSKLDRGGVWPTLLRT